MVLVRVFQIFNLYTSYRLVQEDAIEGVNAAGVDDSSLLRATTPANGAFKMKIGE